MTKILWFKEHIINTFKVHTSWWGDHSPLISYLFLKVSLEIRTSASKFPITFWIILLIIRAMAAPARNSTSYLSFVQLFIFTFIIHFHCLHSLSSGKWDHWPVCLQKWTAPSFPTLIINLAPGHLPGNFWHQAMSETNEIFNAADLNFPNASNYLIIYILPLALPASRCVSSSLAISCPFSSSSASTQSWSTDFLLRYLYFCIFVFVYLYPLTSPHHPPLFRHDHLSTDSMPK